MDVREHCPCDGKTIIYVNANTLSPIQTGKSWSTAYKTLQPALTRASESYGKVYIRIAKGMYIPSMIYTPSGHPGGASQLNTNRLRTFNIPHNTMLTGGYSGHETGKKQECPSENETVLSLSLIHI